METLIFLTLKILFLHGALEFGQMETLIFYRKKLFGTKGGLRVCEDYKAEGD